MDDADALALLPPLQGCLYCHAEGTTTLLPSRQFLGLGSEYATLKCSQCGSTAWLDVDESDLDDWRIRYRRTNHDPRYYYVAIHYGKHGWLDASDALEISPSGPLYGRKTRLAHERPGDRERALLDHEAVDLSDFGSQSPGGRRPFRVPLQEASLSWDEGLLLSFMLPPGSYATSVLREITKTF